MGNYGNCYICSLPLYSKDQLYVMRRKVDVANYDFGLQGNRGVTGKC